MSSPSQAGENVTVTLPIEGMTCAACQSHVEHALKGTPGVSDASVNLMTHSARVVFDPKKATPSELVEAVANSGYEATLPADDAHESDMEISSDGEQSLRAKAIATLVAGAAAMLLSMPLMSMGSHSGMDHLFRTVLPWLYEIPLQVIRVILLLLTVAGMVWAGGPIYGRAWKALLHRSTTMNTLVALGTGAAFVYSAAATFFPTAFLRHGLVPEVYYESVLLILGFLLMGNWLDARAKRRTVDALRSFAALQPQMAILLRDGDEVRYR